MTVDQHRLGVVRLHGKGTRPGIRAFIDALEEGLRVVGGGMTFYGLVDMSALHGTHLRASVLVGRWLLRNKARLERLAIFGGSPWETRIARAVMAVARMKHVGFFADEEQARTWLGGS